MAGHKITPYQLVATRLYERDVSKKKEHLLLASIAKKGTLDLLDVISDNVLKVGAVTSSDETRSVSCVRKRKIDDKVEMIFACDVSGEREVVLDGDDDERPVVFMKDRSDVARIYSCCTLWRPPAGAEGALIVHSPWGRGGSRNQILALLQKAVSMERDAKAKLHASPMIPPEALKQLLRNANATKITYRKATGITSKFAKVTGSTSAPAEMDVVVRGSDSIPFRDALGNALSATTGKDQLFTVSVRNPDGSYREETFDDVEVSIKGSDGSSTTYSVREETVPTMGFSFTSQFNRVYYGLPKNSDAEWATKLMAGGRRYMDGVLQRVIDAQ